MVFELGRTARRLASAVMVAATLGLAACGDDDETPSTDVVVDKEAESLQYMREEEKLARDVYLVLYGIWADSLFSNIAASEQKHTDAVKALLVKYNIPDPAANTAPGVFVNTKLQAAYDSLVASGSTSRLNALVVGVTIEELDIKDISTWKTVVDNTDILQVYDSLMCGSRNHLRSYYDELLKSGGSYVPRYITQAEFDAIVGSAMENCGGF